MTTRHRTVVRHALFGVVLALVGLAWAVQEGGGTAPESARFAAQSADVRSEGLEPGAARLALAAETLPRVVTVVADGATRELATEASTVGEALAAAGVEADPDDRVTPSRDAPVEAGMTVEVARVEVAERSRTETVDFDTVERPSDELAEGARQETRPGQEGLVEVFEKVVLVDGEVQSRSRVGARVRREATDRVVSVGTASQPAQDPSAAGSEPTSLAHRHSASSPSEPAPAEPAPSPSGSGQAPAPEPPAQEPPAPASTGNTQEGEASRYADHFAGDATASGEPYDPAALTAAHRSLPLGTVVTVTNTATGQSVRVRINDRGPHVAGRIIDLSRAAWNRVAPPSAGAVNVRLEW